MNDFENRKFLRKRSQAPAWRRTRPQRILGAHVWSNLDEKCRRREGSRHACRYLLAAERPSAMGHIRRAEDVPDDAGPDARDTEGAAALSARGPDGMLYGFREGPILISPQNKSLTSAKQTKRSL